MELGRKMTNTLEQTDPITLIVSLLGKDPISFLFHPFDETWNFLFYLQDLTKNKASTFRFYSEDKNAYLNIDSEEDLLFFQDIIHNFVLELKE